MEKNACKIMKIAKADIIINRQQVHDCNKKRACI